MKDKIRSLEAEARERLKEKKRPDTEEKQQTAPLKGNINKGREKTIEDEGVKERERKSSKLDLEEVSLEKEMALLYVNFLIQ